MGGHFDRKVKRCETSAKITCLIHPENLCLLPASPSKTSPPRPSSCPVMSGCLPFHLDILPMVEGPARISPWHLRNASIGWRRVKFPSPQASLPSHVPPCLCAPHHQPSLGPWQVRGSTVPYSSSCYFSAPPCLLFLQEAFQTPSTLILGHLLTPSLVLGGQPTAAPSLPVIVSCLPGLRAQGDFLLREANIY